MTAAIGLDDIAEATPDLPNEVCLTLYFDAQKEKGYAARISQLLDPQVGGWQDVGALGMTSAGKTIQTGLRATRPPKNFAAVYLLEIIPKLSSDAYAVQIIVNLTQPIAEAWSLATAWLGDELHIIFSVLPKALLGHTLVYRANVALKAEVETWVPNPSLWRALPTALAQFPIEASQVYSQQYFSNQGWLNLVAVPRVPGDGLVYLALGSTDLSTENDLAHVAYAAYDGLICSLDLFFHKGARQGIELVRDYPRYEREKVEPLKKAIQSLLESASLNKGSSEKELEQMSGEVARQAKFYWSIDRLELSVNQQIGGIERLFTCNEVPPIALHHLAFLRAYQDEVRAYVRKNKTVLDTAQTAIALVEAREAKHSSKIQERFNYIVAFVGIFLAADQILDNEFAKELLSSWEAFPTAAKIPYWIVFFTRLGAAVALAFVLFGLFEMWKYIWREK